jgi:hypothetical protein
MDRPALAAKGSNMSEPMGNSGNSQLFTPSVLGDSPDAIPRLAELDGSRLADQVGLLPTAQWPWGTPREVRIQLLCSHPEPHCTFEIGVRADDGWHRLIGKTYATDHHYVYQVMERLRHAGLGPEDEFSIPRAIAYLPSLHLLLQERVEGTHKRTQKLMLKSTMKLWLFAFPSWIASRIPAKS